MEINDKCLSYDGDADRVVYFYKNSGKENVSWEFYFAQTLWLKPSIEEFWRINDMFICFVFM